MKYALPSTRAGGGEGRLDAVLRWGRVGESPSSKSGERKRDERESAPSGSKEGVGGGGNESTSFGQVVERPAGLALYVIVSNHRHMFHTSDQYFQLMEQSHVLLTKSDG